MDSEAGKIAEIQRCSEAMRSFFHAFRTRFEEDLRPTGITLPQLRLLKAVDGQQEASAASIARECQVTPQTLQAMLARAVREGWITRGTSERNHRFVTATLTTEGKRVLQVAIDLKERIEGVIWHGVSLSAIKDMRETLEAGVNHLAGMEGSPQVPKSHAGQSSRGRSHPSR